ncbi:MAG TPA: pyridoxine 5'-phosphate synthase [Gemmatimonadales bacterium]|nr:pyridoxine 5'-phosphate synthase [Gemmatimonadales bacterium]
MTPIRLYVNIDHVATVRQARRTDEPDPVEAAMLAEANGGDGITVHLREDRRHIQEHDVERLAPRVRTLINLELATSEDVIRFACRLRPYQATLVPERREEITTEGGLDLVRHPARLRETIARLGEAGMRVSLFIDPSIESVERSRELGVPAVELHTGRYAHAWPRCEPALADLVAAADTARRLGMAVHAGHGLTYRNVAPVAALPDIEELNIGHSIVSRAVMVGMGAAVREMRDLVDASRTAI